MIVQYLPNRIDLLNSSLSMISLNNFTVKTKFDDVIVRDDSFRFGLFSAMTTDDRSTLSDDDEGISSDDMDEEDISRRAIHRALMVQFCFLLFITIIRFGFLL